MSFIIEIKKSAEKDFLKLNNPIRDRIKKAILNLKENPLPDGHKKLKNREDYRIRIGDYRVLYQIDNPARTITISRIRHRKEVYKQ